MEKPELIALFVLCSFGVIAGIALLYALYSKKLVLPESDKWYSAFMPNKGHEPLLMVVSFTWVTLSLVGFAVVIKQYFGSN